MPGHVFTCTCRCTCVAGQHYALVAVPVVFSQQPSLHLACDLYTWQGRWMRSSLWKRAHQPLHTSSEHACSSMRTPALTAGSPSWPRLLIDPRSPHQHRQQHQYKHQARRKHQHTDRMQWATRQCLRQICRQKVCRASPQIGQLTG